MQNILQVMKKELKEYFISPIAYVVLTAFVIVVNAVFMKDFFINSQATMRPFFTFVPQILIIVIPALTMRNWAEERQEGTLEVIATLPITKFELIIGKYLSCLIFTLFAIFLTFPLPITLNILGNPDNGVILAGYIGLGLLSASYIAIGQFVSINTTNQIVSFIISSVIISLFYIFGETTFLIYVPSSIRFIFESLGLGIHFRSIAKGVLDTRDILYFLSIIIFCFYFIYKSLVRITTKGK